MIRGLLFDFDGLILDTEAPSLAAWQEIYRAHGAELELAQWSKAVGTVDGFDAMAHLEGLVGGPIDREGLDAARFRLKMELIDLDGPRAGVAQYVEEAQRRGLALAVVSSSPTEWVTSHLDRLGLLDPWHSFHCADGDPARAKPDPLLYLAALAALGLTASEAIAFEDSPNGIRAAKRAGLYCVAIPNEVTALLDLGEADLLVESLASLPLDELLELAG